MSVMLCPCMLCAALLMDLFVCVFVYLFVCCVFDRDCELLSVEVLYWIYHVWSSKECVGCACDPSERLDVPYICLFVFLYVGSYLLI